MTPFTDFAQRPPVFSPPEGTLGANAVTTDAIAEAAVTFDKIETLATGQVIGRSSAGAGAPEALNPEDLAGLVAAETIYQSLADLTSATHPVTAVGETALVRNAALGRPVRYRQIAASATHGGGATSNSGAVFWEIAEPEVAPQMFGAVGDGATNDAIAFRTFLTYCIATGAKGRAPKGDYLVNTNIVATLNEGAVLDVAFDPEARVVCSGVGGTIRVISDPIAALNLAEPVKVGDREVRVSDATGVQHGDFIHVLPDITWSGDSQNPAALMAFVTDVDTTVTPHRIIVSEQSYYHIKPNRQIATVWDGVTATYDYRWRFGDPALVQIFEDGVEKTAGFSAGAGGSAGIPITFTAVPANGASVVFQSSTNVRVNVYRSGKLILRDFRWRADWNDISFTVNKQVLRFEGLSHPEILGAEFITDNYARDSSGYGAFGGPHYLCEGFCMGLRGERIKVRGGGYSLRVQGSDAELRGIDVEGAYKSIDTQGASTNHRYFDMTVRDCVHPLADHGGHEMAYDGLRAQGVKDMWRHRNRGLSVRNAEVEIADGSNLDDGQTGVNYLIDDVRAIPEDNPAAVYKDESVVAGLDLRDVYEDIRFLGPKKPTIVGANVASVRLTRVHNLGGFSVDGSGPPMVGEVILEDVKADELNFRGARAVQAVRCQFKRVTKVEAIYPGAKLSFLDCVSRNDDAGTPNIAFTGRLTGVHAEVQGCTFSGGSLPYAFTFGFAQAGGSLTSRGNVFDGYAAASAAARARFWPASFASNPEVRGRSLISGNTGLGGTATALLPDAPGVFVTEPDAGAWREGQVIFADGGAAVLGWRCDRGGFALGASEQRTTATAYDVGDIVWANVGGAEHVYLCVTAGTSSAADPEPALGTSVNITYSDGTAQWRYWGQKAGFEALNL